MKRIVFFGSSILVMLVLIPAVASINNKNDIPAGHVEVVLREVGHQLLLTAGDSVSRILPIKKLDDNKYQLSFQNRVGFISDSIIDVVQRTFQKNALANEYIVNLRNCAANETVLAFEINGQTGNLTPCRGRKMETGCYLVEIEFLKKSGFNNFLLLLLLIPVGLLGWYLKESVGKKKEKEKASVVDNNDCIQLGKFSFYAAGNLLRIQDKDIVLSGKETKALQIFAQHINEVVERETLMKELWEEEGIVVISRNVDVLVSKLRKKLSDDDAIKFNNVHGKGYRLVIE
jgi:DNA-binding winged helix-turn-helix (wHTH) protein